MQNEDRRLGAAPTGAPLLADQHARAALGAFQLGAFVVDHAALAAMICQFLSYRMICQLVAQLAA